MSCRTLLNWFAVSIFWWNRANVQLRVKFKETELRLSRNTILHKNSKNDLSTVKSKDDTFNPRRATIVSEKVAPEIWFWSMECRECRYFYVARYFCGFDTTRPNSSTTDSRKPLENTTFEEHSREFSRASIGGLIDGQARPKNFGSTSILRRRSADSAPTAKSGDLKS